MRVTYAIILTSKNLQLSWHQNKKENNWFSQSESWKLMDAVNGQHPMSQNNKNNMVRFWVSVPVTLRCGGYHGYQVTFV